MHNTDVGDRYDIALMFALLSPCVSKAVALLDQQESVLLMLRR
jgi:hypothetical protein